MKYMKYYYHSRKHNRYLLSHVAANLWHFSVALAPCGGCEKRRSLRYAAKRAMLPLAQQAERVVWVQSERESEQEMMISQGRLLMLLRDALKTLAVH